MVFWGDFLPPPSNLRNSKVRGVCVGGRVPAATNPPAHVFRVLVLIRELIVDAYFLPLDEYHLPNITDTFQKLFKRWFT